MIRKLIPVMAGTMPRILRMKIPILQVEEDADNSTENTGGTESTLAAILNYTATHIYLRHSITLTPGKGSYDFVEENGAKIPNSR